MPLTHLKTLYPLKNFYAVAALVPEMSIVMPKLQWPEQPQPDTVETGSVIEPTLNPKPVRTPSIPPAALNDNSQLHRAVPSTPTVEPKPAATSKPATLAKPAPKPGTILEDVPITLNVSDGKLSTILSLLMSETHTNLLLLADGKTTLTLNVRNRRFIDTLADICAITNLSYLKAGDEYVIAPDEKLKTCYPEAYAATHPAPVIIKQQEDFVTQSYHTNYVDATKLAAAVAKSYHPGDLNVFIAPEAATPSIDSGVAASNTTGATSTNALAKDDISKMSRIIVLAGPREEVQTAVQLFSSMDVEPAQVSIQVEVHDISVSAADQLGLTWTMPTETFTENAPTGVALNDYVRSPLSFSAQLNALQSKGLDKLMARPNISVNDGQRGYVLVGDRIQYPVETGQSLSGTPIYSTEQQDVGIYLQVSAWITNDGKVTLDLYPQVSTISGYTTIAGSQYPNISTRESQSVVTIESGKTFVIAGLIQDEDITNIQGVPILDSLPFLKELFTYRSKSHTKNEVIITITPTIVNH